MEIDENLIAPCGLYCGWCPFYVLKPRGYACPGCWRREEKCSIRDCASSKGLRLCTFCDDFPCDHLYRMYENMSRFFDDVKRILRKEE